MTMQEFIALPFTEQARLALADLKRAMNDHRYKVDMGYWHCPEWLIRDKKLGKDLGNRDPACVVCLAGAKLTEWMEPNAQYLPRQNDSLLEACESLSAGDCEAMHAALDQIDNFREDRR